MPAFLQHSYPYLLPCIVAFASGIASFVVAYKLLPETLTLKRGKQSQACARRCGCRSNVAQTAVVSDQVPQRVQFVDAEPETIEMKVLPPMFDVPLDEEGEDAGAGVATRSSQGKQYMPLAVEEDSVDAPHTMVDLAVHEADMSEKDELGGLVQPAPAHQSVLMSLLRDRAVLLTITIYSIFSFAVIGIDEMYPLWASTPFRLGGLGWTQAQSMRRSQASTSLTVAVGTSLAVAGGFLVVIQARTLACVVRPHTCPDHRVSDC